MEFFRHCPGCGRRFHIKLEARKLVTSHTEVIPNPVQRTGVARTIGRGLLLTFTPLTEGRPVIVDVEEFQYAYKCMHCGHEWSETHVEEHREA